MSTTRIHVTCGLEDKVVHSRQRIISNNLYNSNGHKNPIKKNYCNRNGVGIVSELSIDLYGEEIFFFFFIGYKVIFERFFKEKTIKKVSLDLIFLLSLFPLIGIII